MCFVMLKKNSPTHSSCTTECTVSVDICIYALMFLLSLSLKLQCGCMNVCDFTHAHNQTLFVSLTLQFTAQL